jgi:hypothetical protein
VKQHCRGIPEWWILNTRRPVAASRDFAGPATVR